MQLTLLLQQCCSALGTNFNITRKFAAVTDGAHIVRLQTKAKVFLDIHDVM
jgi:hypothetical protein